MNLVLFLLFIYASCSDSLREKLSKVKASYSQEVIDHLIVKSNPQVCVKEPSEVKSSCISFVWEFCWLSHNQLLNSTSWKCVQECLLQFVVIEQEESVSNEGSKWEGRVTINVK